MRVVPGWGVRAASCSRIASARMISSCSKPGRRLPPPGSQLDGENFLGQAAAVAGDGAAGGGSGGQRRRRRHAKSHRCRRAFGPCGSGEPALQCGPAGDVAPAFVRGVDAARGDLLDVAALDADSLDGGVEGKSERAVASNVRQRAAVAADRCEGAAEDHCGVARHYTGSSPVVPGVASLTSWRST